VGRGGAIISPIIVGFMFQAGLPLSTVSMVISTGALIAVVVLVFLKLERKTA